MKQKLMFVKITIRSNRLFKFSTSKKEQILINVIKKTKMRI